MEMDKEYTRKLEGLKKNGLIEHPINKDEYVLRSWLYNNEKYELSFYSMYKGLDKIKLDADEVVRWINKLYKTTSKTEIVKKQGDIEYMENKNNYDELRTLLFDTIRDLRSGKIEPEHAKAISLLSQSIINSVKSELEAKKYIDRKDKVNMLN